MRILVVDNSRRAAQVVAKLVNRAYPDAAVETQVARDDGGPTSIDALTDYDSIIVGELSRGGLTLDDLLADVDALEEKPPLIVLLDKADQALTSRALGAGVAEVLIKRELDPVLLGTAISKSTRLPPPATEQQAVSADADIVDQASEAGDGGYRFIRLIGQGAASRVYLGERNSDKQTVVLKILDGSLSRDAESAQRFVREAAMARDIDSPHVVRIYDQGFTEQYGFMAMEFFSRGDLEQRVRMGITPETARSYLYDIAQGLAAIHAAGIVHRDLKPANIMFRGDDVLVIADFGVSKRVDGDSSLTMTGGVLGTPLYMSPEQLQAKTLDGRTDLYSAGIILYEMVAGERPFNAESVPGIVMKHMQEEPPPLPLPAAAMEPIYRKLVAKDRDERYDTAGELAADLAAVSLT